MAQIGCNGGEFRVRQISEEGEQSKQNLFGEQIVIVKAGVELRPGCVGGLRAAAEIVEIGAQRVQTPLQLSEVNLIAHLGTKDELAQKFVPARGLSHSATLEMPRRQIPHGGTDLGHR